jgi:tetratricopeptide (TPR) repeat protein
MRYATFALVTLAAAAVAGSASAYVFVAAGRLSTACYENARDGLATAQALDQCDGAMTEALSPHDRAATYINRGVVHMNRGNPARALADFDNAIALQPQLAEGYINRGAALLVQNDLRGAIAAIDQGLQYTPEDPARAYYNRGVAHEDLGEIRAAYHDYRRAAELAPTWDAPRVELARFRVS